MNIARRETTTAARMLAASAMFLSNSGWNADKTRIRNEVNRWVRTSAAFDDVIDFDAVVRDPANHDLIYAPFDCGDGIHPSPAGYYALGRSVNLRVFRDRGRRR